MIIIWNALSGRITSGCLVFVLFSTTLYSPPGRAGDFGLGVALGDPSMLVAQYRMAPGRWLDAGLSWNTTGRDSFYAHGDYLWNRPDIFKSKIPFFLFYGVGFRLTTREVDDKPHPDKKQETGIGVRIPVGLSHFLPDPSFEFFAQLAPVVELIPDFEIDVDGGIGFRFYF